MLRRVAGSLFFAACLLLSHGRALAQATPGDETEQARALFQEGLDLADSGDWERAVHRFRRALELRDAAPVRYNLATSLARMGRLVEALEEANRIVASAETDDAVRAATETLREELRPRLGGLTVEVDGEVEGAFVTVDGRPWDQLGVMRPADPGLRVVRLMLDRDELDMAEADVPEGGAARIVLEVPREGSNEPSTSGEAGSDDGWVWGVVIGLVLVAAGAGIVTGVVLSEQGPQPSMGDFMPGVLEVD